MQEVFSVGIEKISWQLKKNNVYNICFKVMSDLMFTVIGLTSISVVALYALVVLIKDSKVKFSWMRLTFIYY